MFTYEILSLFLEYLFFKTVCSLWRISQTFRHVFILPVYILKHSPNQKTQQTSVESNKQSRKCTLPQQAESSGKERVIYVTFIFEHAGVFLARNSVVFEHWVTTNVLGLKCSFSFTGQSAENQQGFPSLVSSRVCCP